MIAIISVVLFLVILYAINRFIASWKRKVKYQVPKDIKKNFAKIDVSTNDIVILSREDYEAVSEEPDDAPLPLYVAPGESVSTLKSISILTYDDFSQAGKKQSFRSMPLEKSGAELKELFGKEKTITIYYNPTNPADHYFDIYHIIKDEL